MNKLLKIFLGFLIAVVVLVIVVVALVALFFDANSFRGRITDEVKQATGRELTLDDIHLSIFPTLGARIKGATFSNAAGFGDQPFARVGEAEVGVRIMPLLLHRAVEVSSITLDGLQLNLTKQADGKTNWDDLTQSKSPKPNTPAPASANSSAAGSGIRSIDIGGISIKNSALSFADAKTGKTYALSKLKLETGSIRPGKSFDFDLAFTTALSQAGSAAQSSTATITADTELSARLTFDLDRQTYRADQLKVKLEASGKDIPEGKQKAELDADLDYDGGKGTVSLANGRIEAGGLDATASFTGGGLNGADGRFSGPLEIKSFNPRDLLKRFGMSLDTADPAALSSASLSAQIDGSKDAVRLSNLKLLLDQSHLSGSLGLDSFATQAITFALNADQLDADRYLPPPQAQAPITPAAQKVGGGNKKGSGDAAELPVDALENLNARGTLDVGSFKLQNLSMTSVQIKLNAPKSAPKNVDLAARLYGGTISDKTRITPGPRPSYVETVKLDSISTGPLLKDFLGKDYVTGTGNVSMNLTANGRTVGEAKRSLNGDASVNLQNGAVKGFNLAQIIRQGQALINGQQFSGGAAQQTDFTQASITGKFVNGVLHSDDLNAASPLLRLTGAGQVDLVNQTIDYTAKPMVVNSSTGQGGKQLADLNGVVIPIHVTGTFGAPRYSLDVQSALQQKAVDRLTQKIGERLGDKNGDLTNKLRQGLGSLFGKPKQDNSQQTPQNH